MAFRRNFASNKISASFSVNFQGTYCFITPKLLNDNSWWTLTSHEISRESSLFSIVRYEISEGNLLWLVSVRIQTKQNTATVRDLFLCKET